jgi:hypothetical protein
MFGPARPASGLGQSLVDRLNDAGMKLFVETLGIAVSAQ